MPHPTHPDPAAVALVGWPSRRSARPARAFVVGAGFIREPEYRLAKVRTGTRRELGSVHMHGH